MTEQEWVDGLEPHDYNTITLICMSKNGNKQSSEEQRLVVAAFVRECLYRYGGTKEQAVLEYCAHALYA